MFPRLSRYKSYRQTQKEGRGVALPILNLGARKGGGVSATLCPLFPREGEPVHIVEEAGRTDLTAALDKS